MSAHATKSDASSPGEDWEGLSARFAERLDLRPAPGVGFAHYGARLLLSVGLLGACWGWFHGVQPQGLLRVVAWCIAGFAMVQCGMLGHDLGHGYLPGGMRRTRWVGHLLVTFPTGLSFDHWCTQHAAHHRRTHDALGDPDLQVAALALGDQQVAPSPATLAIRRTQGWWFWAVPAVQPVSMRLNSWRHLFHPEGRSWVAAAALVAHYALWLVVPVVVFERSFGGAFLDWFAHSSIGGFYMAGVFFVNHLGRPTWTGARPHRMEISVARSRSLSPHPLVTLLMAGLNHHAEHHLLPNVPTHQLAQVRTALEGACADVGVRYPRFTFVGALAEMYAGVRRLGREAR